MRMIFHCVQFKYTIFSKNLYLLSASQINNRTAVNSRTLFVKLNFKAIIACVFPRKKMIYFDFTKSDHVRHAFLTSHRMKQSQQNMIKGFQECISFVVIRSQDFEAY